MKVVPILTVLSSAVFGFFVGISFPVEITPKVCTTCYFSFPLRQLIRYLNEHYLIFATWACLCSSRTAHYSLSVAVQTPATVATYSADSGHHTPTALLRRQKVLNVQRASYRQALWYQSLIFTSAGYGEPPATYVPL